MSKPHQSQTIEPLWSMPQSIIDRISETEQDSEYNTFLLSGFYCLIAVIFLLFFGIAALVRADSSFAYTIFGFALATVLCYGSIWLSGLYLLGKHFIVLLMATLCVYLFYTGGTEGTGPIFFFIFPLVAVFLQGYRNGLISIITLMALSILINKNALFGFDPDLYEAVFLTRVLAVYIIIAILSTLFAYFRYVAEHDLLLAHEDIGEISYLDHHTGIANRNLMEKLLTLELNRYTRYKAKFCVILLAIDSFENTPKERSGNFTNYVLNIIAQVLNETLRNTDIPARWQNNELLVLLPETKTDTANKIAERVLKNISNKEFYLHNNTQDITINIGINESNNEDLSEILHLAEKNLFKATQTQGNTIVI